MWFQRGTWNNNYWENSKYFLYKKKANSIFILPFATPILFKEQKFPITVPNLLRRWGEIINNLNQPVFTSKKPEVGLLKRKTSAKRHISYNNRRVPEWFIISFTHSPIHSFVRSIQFVLFAHRLQTGLRTIVYPA